MGDVEQQHEAAGLVLSLGLFTIWPIFNPSVKGQCWAYVGNAYRRDNRLGHTVTNNEYVAIL